MRLSRKGERARERKDEEDKVEWASYLAGGAGAICLGHHRVHGVDGIQYLLVSLLPHRLHEGRRGGCAPRWSDTPDRAKVGA